jgi:hypothetical protein
MREHTQELAGSRYRRPDQNLHNEDQAIVFRILPRKTAALAFEF